MFGLFRYRGNVTRIVDGDTIEAELYLGLGVTHWISIRLSDVDAPEVTGEEKEVGDEVERLLTERLSECDNKIFVQLEGQNGDVTDSFGRHLAFVYPIDSEKSLSQLVRKWSKKARQKAKKQRIKDLQKSIDENAEKATT